MFYNYPLDIDSETWAEVLQNKQVTREDDLAVLGVVYEGKNHEARGSEIAARLGLPRQPGRINFRIVSFSKRVITATKAHPPINTEGKPEWWHVFFLGYNQRKTFPWIMRPELVIAWEKVFGVANAEDTYSGEIASEDTDGLLEGAVSQVFVNRYERNRRARSICIAHYSSRCAICGFDFEQMYGPIGKDKVHVHHSRPLAGIREEYEINPIKDLCPVCANCHLIIHSKREPFTVEEVRRMIRFARAKQE